MQGSVLSIALIHVWCLIVLFCKLVSRITEKVVGVFSVKFGNGYIVIQNRVD